MSATTLDQMERQRRITAALNREPISLKEIVITFLVSLFVTPFFAVMFSVLPMIGQILAIPLVLLTLYYFKVRKSILAFLVAMAGSFSVVMFTVITIQQIKYHLEIPLFIFLVLGVPVAFFYSMLVGMRIWKILER